MSTPTLSHEDQLKKELVEAISGSSPDVIKAAIMSLPEEKSAAVLRHIASSLVQFYASDKGLHLDALRFSLNGRILDADCPTTGEQLGMDAMRNDVIHVRVVPKTGLTTICFVDEVGTILDLDAHPHLQLYRLCQTYFKMRGMGLVYDLLQFTFKGERLLLQFRCKDLLCDARDETLSQLGMTDGDIIYVSFQMPSRKQLDEDIKAIPQLAQVQPPHSFVNCRVVDDPAYEPSETMSPEEFVPHRVVGTSQFGTVVGYSGHRDDTIWTAEYPDNITKKYTRDELIDCMQTYYWEKNGFERDVLAHLEQQAERLQSEMSSLEQGEGADGDASILNALRIEQEIDQLEKNLARLPGFRGIVAEQTLGRLEFNLGDVRRALVRDGICCKANKPMLMAGETVYAKRWQADNSDAEPSWKRGRVESFQCFDEDASGYGPRREYCVTFDDGDVQNGISEDQVAYESEHRTKREFSETKWIGVERRVDTESTDPWASKVGWYVAKIEGIEQPFTYLFDALRAYDAQTVAWEGADIEEEQLINIPSDGWHVMLESLKEQNVTYSEIKTRQRMRVRLLLSRERVAHNSDMHRIGTVLFQWANRTPTNGDDDELEQLGCKLARTYKECQGQFLDGNATSMRERLYLFALIRQCVEEAWDFDQLCRFFIGAEGNIDRFLRSVPIFREGYDAASEGVNESTEAMVAGFLTMRKMKQLHNKLNKMMAYLCSHEPLHTDAFRIINIVDTSNNAQKDTIELGGRPAFLSAIGKKSLEALGLKDDEMVKVTVMQSSPPETNRKEELQRKPQRQKSKGKGKKKGTAKSKKKQPHKVELPVNDKERDKKQWLDAISQVFVEADPQFREIRQRLSALSLQRTAPKQRRRQPKEEATAAETTDNPPLDGLGGKAGKSQFVVQVGEVANLYKTAKPSAARKQSGQIAREVDLHGCTTAEALAKLDECLPEWVDTAMKGEYPWVIAVRIVCGGGSQTLAEAVEGWIRQSPNVSNAPKNLYTY
ncbi:hypothetical protein ACHAXT_000194 [Thalassiosira profunda]